MQTKMKNKEITFLFEDASANYLKFLLTMLIKHGYDKLTSVSNCHRFGVRVIIPPNKACDFTLFLLLFDIY